MLEVELDGVGNIKQSPIAAEPEYLSIGQEDDAAAVCCCHLDSLHYVTTAAEKLDAARLVLRIELAVSKLSVDSESPRVNVASRCPTNRVCISTRNFKNLALVVFEHLDRDWIFLDELSETVFGEAEGLLVGGLPDDGFRLVDLEGVLFESVAADDTLVMDSCKFVAV